MSFELDVPVYLYLYITALSASYRANLSPIIMKPANTKNNDCRYRVLGGQCNLPPKTNLDVNLGMFLAMAYFRPFIPINYVTKYCR